MRTKFKCNFEELDNDTLRITGKITHSFFWLDEQRDSIIIKKEWIPWIITTLRNATIDDYNTPQTLINEYADCDLILNITLAMKLDYSYIKIRPIWKDETRITPVLEIPYKSWIETQLMSEFIEPFLAALSQFLTEKEKLPPPWSENEPENAQIASAHKRKKDASVNFEYDFEESDNDELRINGKRTGSFGGGQWKRIVIKKEWIPWIITTLRNYTVEDYKTGNNDITKQYGDGELTVKICPIKKKYAYITIEKECSYIKIFPNWKDKKKTAPALEIPYLPWIKKAYSQSIIENVKFEFDFEELDNEIKIMSEFIEPFLVSLTQFLTEEEREKLPPPWSEREEEKQDKKKRKKKKDGWSDDGRISVRFVGEIDPRDYFGLWNEDNDIQKE